MQVNMVKDEWEFESKYNKNDIVGFNDKYYIAKKDIRAYEEAPDLHSSWKKLKDTCGYDWKSHMKEREKVLKFFKEHGHIPPQSYRR